MQKNRSYQDFVYRYRPLYFWLRDEITIVRQQGLLVNPGTLWMTDVKKLLKKHGQLNQLDGVKVVSHVQRDKDDWVLNTIMLEGYGVPFQYRRKEAYKNLTGGRVNLTYYADIKSVAGVDFEIMNVVRIRRS
jgi:hypothetical protein